MRCHGLHSRCLGPAWSRAWAGLLSAWNWGLGSVCCCCCYLLLLFVVVCCPFLGCFVYLGLLVGIRYARGFLLKGGRRPPGLCSVRNNLSTSGFNLVVSLCRHRVALPCLVLPCSNSSLSPRYLPLFPVRYHRRIRLYLHSALI